MDDNRGQRRQNEPPIYSSSSSRHHQTLHDQSQQRRPFPGTQAERYRPAPISASPSGPPRGISGSSSYSGYYQTPSATGFPTAAMPQGTMSYHHSTADYGQADSRQTPSFGSTYNPAMMYNVQQTGGPQSASVYDASQQYSSRQAAGLPMMTTDVTAPYFQNEPTNAAASSSLQAQTASSSTPEVYQQSGIHGYSAGSVPSIGGMASQTASAPDVRMEEEYSPAAGGFEDAFAAYQTGLKDVFQNIRSGDLTTASSSLLQISNWLLPNVVELGLTSDEQTARDERIKLWNNFNHAWLAIFQRQKELMESGQPLQRPQSLITQEGLRLMGKDLVRLCDGIERHGLVDYQYGVWEEQIIDILEQCLDLFEPSNTSGGGGEESSIARRR